MCPWKNPYDQQVNDDDGLQGGYRSPGSGAWGGIRFNMWNGKKFKDQDHEDHEEGGEIDHPLASAFLSHGVFLYNLKNPVNRSVTLISYILQMVMGPTQVFSRIETGKLYN